MSTRAASFIEIFYPPAFEESQLLDLAEPLRRVPSWTRPKNPPDRRLAARILALHSGTVKRALAKTGVASVAADGAKALTGERERLVASGARAGLGRLIGRSLVVAVAPETLMFPGLDRQTTEKATRPAGDVDLADRLA